VVEGELHLALGVGDARAAAEFGGREGGWHRGHAHCVGIEHRQRWCAAFGRERHEAVHVAYVAPQGEQHGLGRVGDRPATDGEQVVRVQLARQRGAADHRFTRGMSAYRVEFSDAAIAERRGHFADELPVRERAGGEQEHAFHPEAFDFAANRFRDGPAMYHPLLRHPLHRTRQHASRSSR
jgi:hypothetical protein